MSLYKYMLMIFAFLRTDISFSICFKNYTNKPSNGVSFICNTLCCSEQIKMLKFKSIVK